MVQPLASVVVPVFNVEPFCRKCFDSLLAIDYKNIEIILVDDCSTDGCGDICDEYSRKSKNVHVIHHSKNEGVAQARLTGTQYAHGEYVMFVDSDDYVAPQIMKIMIQTLLTNRADFVICQSFIVEGSSLSIRKRSILGVYDKDDINCFLQKNALFDSELNYSGIILYLCGKLFKRVHLLDSLKKGIGMTSGEDGIVFLDILINKTFRCVCLDEPLYYYVRHPSQVTQRPLYVMWPHYVTYWERLDSINTGEGWSEQLSRRIWSYIKPTIYDNYKNWGGIINDNRFVQTFHALRNSAVVERNIWNNENLPVRIKRHPHYILLKYRLYWLDYVFYFIMWSIKKK